MQIKEAAIGICQYNLDSMSVCRVFVGDAADKTDNPIALISFFKGKEGTLFVELRVKAWDENNPKTPVGALEAFKHWWSKTDKIDDQVRAEVQRQLGQMCKHANFKISDKYAKDYCSFSNYLLIKK